MAASHNDATPFGGGSEHDLYLSPHYDDICFSLGSFVSRRRAGAAITFFSNSAFVVPHNLADVPPHPGAFDYFYLVKVSAVRRAEDLAFARSVGLRQVVAGLDEAPVRGRQPFANADTNSVEDASLFNDKVMSAISMAGGERPPDLRPWLYCPMAIGGHVDHLVVLRVVLRNCDALAGAYRIAFYEDLHYASAIEIREAGLVNFRRLAGPLAAKRFVLPIDDVGRKLDLIGLYASQIAAKPANIDSFTPAVGSIAPPHEAIWTAEPHGSSQ
ncbi:MAG: hypothetical protein ACLPSW_11060 [Roseiarcus sp.]